MQILVTGGGGFIGHHLIKRLKQDGHYVRGVDLHFPEFEHTDADEFFLADLRTEEACLRATDGIDFVYNLAADMGGIGYITAKFADIATNNSLINIHMLNAARDNKVRRFLFSSSACVYPASMQRSEYVDRLAEIDAIPAEPEAGYGWEKLYAEQLCSYFQHDFGLDVRVVRFHNVYGPLGAYDGGKEKSPAALCRKIANVLDGDAIEIWGDGNQTRSYIYIDDCVEGLIRLMNSNFNKPLNLGTERLISIYDLAHMIFKFSGKQPLFKFDLTKPQGVRGRNSDNTLLRITLDWEPQVTLEDGIQKTYWWIHQQVKAKCSQSV